MKEGGSHKREYILIDDGSTDSSAAVINSLLKKLPGRVIFIKRKNMGASFSTNQAVNLANAFWIRLLDGDDCVTYKSTEKMLNLALKYKTEFVYGKMKRKEKKFYNDKNKDHIFQTRKSGLKKFIRNCPANSSCIFLSKRRYYYSGGCNESFVSPDPLLFLRLFASGSGVFLKSIVTLLPFEDASKERLSNQIKRSRYESIFALIKFCEENSFIDTKIRKMAYKRSISRAFNYYKYFTNSFFSLFLWYYIYSKFFFPQDYTRIMYRCLSVFNEKEKNKPYNWLTGSDKYALSKSRIRN